MRLIKGKEIYGKCGKWKMVRYLSKLSTASPPPALRTPTYCAPSPPASCQAPQKQFFSHGRVARGHHGLLKVLPGPIMPDPSTSWGQPTPETSLQPFLGWPTHMADGLWPSSTLLNTPRRTLTVFQLLKPELLSWDSNSGVAKKRINTYFEAIKVGGIWDAIATRRFRRFGKRRRNLKAKLTGTQKRLISGLIQINKTQVGVIW
jgi:hypothetical protein